MIVKPGDRLYLVPVALAIAGLAIPLAATGGEFLPFALFWLAASIGVAVLLRLFRQVFWARRAVALTIVVACPVFTFEGGLFVVPAAVALLVIEGRRYRPWRVAHPGKTG